MRRCGSTEAVPQKPTGSLITRRVAGVRGVRDRRLIYYRFLEPLPDFDSRFTLKSSILAIASLIQLKPRLTLFVRSVGRPKLRLGFCPMTKHQPFFSSVRRT